MKTPNPAPKPNATPTFAVGDKVRHTFTRKVGTVVRPVTGTGPSSLVSVTYDGQTGTVATPLRSLRKVN